jgi:hypothetical protein
MKINEEQPEVIIVNKPTCAFCGEKLKGHIDEFGNGRIITCGKIFCSEKCYDKYMEEKEDA